MTETTQTADPIAKPALGVGTLIGDSFRTYGKRFVPLTIVAFVPLIIAALIGVPLAPTDSAQAVGVGAVVLTLLSILAGLLGQAVIIQVAYDAKLGRSTDYAGAVRRAFSKILYIFVLGIALSIAAGVATLALIVPGLWVFAALSVTVPAIVVEDANWRGLSRSWELTKEYRWPILGVIVVMYIPFIVLSIAGTFASVTVAGIAGSIVGVVVLNVVSAIGTALINLALVLIYARLREIKEGISVDRIADVFA